MTYLKLLFDRSETEWFRKKDQRAAQFEKFHKNYIRSALNCAVFLKNFGANPYILKRAEMHWNCAGNKLKTPATSKNSFDFKSALRCLSLHLVYCSLEYWSSFLIWFMLTNSLERNAMKLCRKRTRNFPTCFHRISAFFSAFFFKIEVIRLNKSNFNDLKFRDGCQKLFKSTN